MSVTLWFMGRPAAGKSTLANRIATFLREQDRPVENLDGDEIRKNLHPDLGFSRDDRRTNNKRTAFISKLLNRNGITTVTGMITPFRDAQKQAREIIEPDGTFVLIYVKCSVDEAARRDPKNLYEDAKAGKIENFTGISHPFQEPHNPDIVVDTENATVEENVEYIKQRLYDLEVLDDQSHGVYGFEMSRTEEETIKERLEQFGYISSTDKT